MSQLLIFYLLWKEREKKNKKNWSRSCDLPWGEWVRLNSLKNKILICDGQVQCKIEKSLIGLSCIRQLQIKCWMLPQELFRMKRRLYHHSFLEKWLVIQTILSLFRNKNKCYLSVDLNDFICEIRRRTLWIAERSRS